MEQVNGNRYRRNIQLRQLLQESEMGTSGGGKKNPSAVEGTLGRVELKTKVPKGGHPFHRELSVAKRLTEQFINIVAVEKAGSVLMDGARETPTSPPSCFLFLKIRQGQRALQEP